MNTRGRRWACLARCGWTDGCQQAYWTVVVSSEDSSATIRTVLRVGSRDNLWVVATRVPRNLAHAHISHSLQGSVNEWN